MKFTGSNAKRIKNAQLAEYDKALKQLVKEGKAGAYFFTMFDKEIYSTFNSDKMCEWGFGPYDPRDYNTAYDGTVANQVQPIHPPLPEWAQNIAFAAGDIAFGAAFKVGSTIKKNYNKLSNWLWDKEETSFSDVKKDNDEKKAG